jgi:hypothetical protein
MLPQKFCFPVPYEWPSRHSDIQPNMSQYLRAPSEVRVSQVEELCSRSYIWVIVARSLKVSDMIVPKMTSKGSTLLRVWQAWRHLRTYLAQRFLIYEIPWIIQLPLSRGIPKDYHFSRYCWNIREHGVNGVHAFWSCNFGWSQNVRLEYSRVPFLPWNRVLVCRLGRVFNN